MRLVRWIVVSLTLSGLFVLPARAEVPVQFPSKPLQPFVVVRRTSSLSVAEAQRIMNVAADAGATGYVVNFPFLGLTAHKRGETELLRLTNRWRILMATMVMPQEMIRSLGGESMASAAIPGQVLMGETAADVRNAEVGDTIVLRDKNFQPFTFVVGAIVPDSFVDWGDIAMSTEAASVFGPLRRSNVTIVNITSYTQLLQKLKAKKIYPGTTWRFINSWDRKNPDWVLGTSGVKKKFGEFEYRTAGSSVEISPAWRSRNLHWREKFVDIPITNNCHREVAPALQGALTEIKNAGLASQIDVRNTNRYGGCYAGRYNRRAGTYGSLSRHAWGIAIDLNTTTNPLGGVPRLSCAVVHIFRKWGFAWGGNFRPADGMHFEYVGEPRHEVGYPSRYCRNTVAIPATTLPMFNGGLSTSTSTTVVESTTTTSVTPTTSTP